VAERPDRSRRRLAVATARRAWRIAWHSVTHGSGCASCVTGCARCRHIQAAAGRGGTP